MGTLEFSLVPLPERGSAFALQPGPLDLLVGGCSLYRGKIGPDAGKAADEVDGDVRSMNDEEADDVEGSMTATIGNGVETDV